MATDRRRRRRKSAEVALEEAIIQAQPDGTDLVDLRQALLVGLAQLPAGMRALLVLLGEPLPPGSVQLLQQLRRRGRVRPGA